ncbi:cobalamin-dependent protein [Deltaproteobacteria bacterium OttesenSCG-928-K17]|nr:cobalamin-dependent protein [Deltaproteobacteria bacterium OttesenSCG-928-K17]
MTQINEATGLTIWGINPPVYDFAWFDLWAAPMGLLNYMGYLRDRGNRVHLLDAIYEGRCQSLTYGRWKTRRQKIEKPAVFGDVARPYYRYGLSAEEMEARLAAMPPPDLILITSIMTYWYPGVYEAVRTVKKLFPKVPAVVGGVYATLCPDHALAGGG